MWLSKGAHLAPQNFRSAARVHRSSQSLEFPHSVVYARIK
jgi:hypothetical protein